jgi:hypothetical protein
MANVNELMAMGLPASVAASMAQQTDTTKTNTETLRGASLRKSSSAGIMIPLYLYPANPYSDGAIQGLLALIRQYRTVPTIVIVNPDNGPGTAWDGNYAATIRLLKAAGATVCGYVATGYGGTAKETVEADVAAWQKIYAADPRDLPG